MTLPPLVLAGTADAAEFVTSRLVRDGWLVQSGWELHCSSWAVDSRRVVCVGTLSDEGDAASALLAAARGAGLVVVAGARNDVLERFFEDLRHLGPVAFHPDSSCVGQLCSLEPEQRRLLELLSEGMSLGEAARRLHVSRRTADRRLAAARSALNVRTTAEAVVAARREREPNA